MNIADFIKISTQTITSSRFDCLLCDKKTKQWNISLDMMANIRDSYKNKLLLLISSFVLKQKHWWPIVNGSNFWSFAPQSFHNLILNSSTLNPKFLLFYGRKIGASTRSQPPKFFGEKAGVSGMKMCRKECFALVTCEIYQAVPETSHYRSIKEEWLTL